jgi:DNA-binding LacI/PurR family transcriptional regulator
MPKMECPMKRILIATTMLIFASFPVRADAPVPEGELASLQAAMQSHIDQNLVDGALLHLDEKTGKVRPLYPAKAHPKIMALGKYYYMCANFRDQQGAEVMVNFFAAKTHDRYVIFHTDFDANEELEHLLEKNAAVTNN